MSDMGPESFALALLKASENLWYSVGTADRSTGLFIILVDLCTR